MYIISFFVSCLWTGENSLKTAHASQAAGGRAINESADRRHHFVLYKTISHNISLQEQATVLTRLMCNIHRSHDKSELKSFHAETFARVSSKRPPRDSIGAVFFASEYPHPMCASASARVARMQYVLSEQTASPRQRRPRIILSVRL